jgi:N-glycosylase/DNA lyase
MLVKDYAQRASQNLHENQVTMGKLRISEWHKLPVSLAELCIDTTLRCGQSFRWKKLQNNEWYFQEPTPIYCQVLTISRSCALHGRIISLKQDSTHLHYRTIRPSNGYPISPPSSAKSSKLGTPSEEEDDTESLLRHYLNLAPDLTALYEYWSSVDSNFKKRAPKFTGVRILKQDAWEALVGFICSSNNNIVRISQMVWIYESIEVAA